MEGRDLSKCSQCGLSDARAQNRKLAVCSGCHSKAYCSRDCQIRAWKGGHKRECQRLTLRKEKSVEVDKLGSAIPPSPTASSTTPRRIFGRFEQMLTSEVCDTFSQTGYAVVDNCLGQEWSNAILNELKFLHEESLLKPNKTQFFRPGGTPIQYTKPNIFEADLHAADVRQVTPELDALFNQTALVEALESKLADCLPLLARGTRGHTLKVQVNEGRGGCFPCHYDNPGHPNLREVTCILYLNPGWQPGDGGEIELWPFLGRPVRVAPRMDRLVIFRSARILHRVLPAKAQRFCLTIWLDKADKSKVEEESTLRLTQSQMENWESLCDYLRRSPVQRLLSRGVYEELYEESLKQCMQDAEGFDEMMSAHTKQIETLKNNKALYSLVERLRASKFDGEPLSIL